MKTVWTAINHCILSQNCVQNVCIFMLFLRVCVCVCVCVFVWVGGCEWVGARVWPYPNFLTFSHTHQGSSELTAQKTHKFIIFVFPKHSRSIRISFRATWGTFLRLLKDQQGPLERSFFLAGINVSHVHVCADITDPLIQVKNYVFFFG